MVNWILIVTIGVFALLLILFLLKKFNKKLFDFKIFKKIISIGTPHRLEVFFLALYFFFFFIADLAQNKVLDLGLDYKVIVFWNTTMLASQIWAIFIVLFHVALIGLFLMSLKSKQTNRTFDIIIGAIALLGISILVGGFFIQIYSPTLPIIFEGMRSIDFYHIGAYISMFAGFYYAFTR